MHKQLLTIILSSLFYLLSPSLALAVCPSEINDNDVTIANGNTCTIPAGYTYILDKVSGENSSANTAALSLTGGSLTIANTATLRTATLVPNGGSVVVQNGGTIIIGGTSGNGIWVADGDADGYAANFTTYTATAAGRRRIGLMKSKTVADCNDANINVRLKEATGGTITYPTGYIVHSFTGSGTFTITCGGTTTVDYLVVAGGASGGTSIAGGGGGGGGGAGGLLTSSVSLSQGVGYGATVGGGGAAQSGGAGVRGASGSNSVFHNITTYGGGAGGGYNSGSPPQCQTGGSGGGMAYRNAGWGVTWCNEVSGQGYHGGQDNGSDGASGGGGAGAIGSNSGGAWNGGAGGAGVASSITGSSVTYAVGGQGADANGNPNSCESTSGAANTGNGGIGGTALPCNSGAGGSGVVIVRYANP